MKTRLPMLVSMLTVFGMVARAQDNTPPASAAAPEQTEMRKWIATTDAQWQAVLKREVMDLYEAELNQVKLQYLASIDGGIAKASGAGDLDEALALRKERKRFGDTNVFLEKDEESEAASVKQLRAAIRLQLAKLEKDKTARIKTVQAKYDQVLAQAQIQLTQHQRLDDALLVKNKRAEIAAAWLGGNPDTLAIEGTPRQKPMPSEEKPKPPESALIESAPTAQPLDEFLAGTKWLWYGRNGQVLEFGRDGKVHFDDWTKKGLVTDWKVMAPNRVILSIVSGRSKMTGATLVFSDDHTSFTGTDFGGKRMISKSPRAPGGD